MPQRYARLAQRVNTWLTSMTAAGHLYETDLRLRPDGEAGLIVSSLGAFRRYQREHAWTWEHQALTRARFVAGDPAIGAAFEAERDAILRLPRDAGKLAAEVVEMRRRDARRPPESDPALRPQARSRRNGRHRVRGAVPRAHARLRASGADPQCGQHRAPPPRRRPGARAARSRARGRGRLPGLPQAAARTAPRRRAACADRSRTLRRAARRGVRTMASRVRRGMAGRPRDDPLPGTVRDVSARIPESRTGRT